MVQLGRPGKQTQHEENQYLHQSGQAVEKAHHSLLTLEFFVSERHTYYVGTQITVAAHQFRQGIGCNSHGEYEESIKAVRRETHMLQGPGCALRYQKAQSRSENNLCENHPGQ